MKLIDRNKRLNLSERCAHFIRFRKFAQLGLYYSGLTNLFNGIKRHYCYRSFSRWF